MSAARRVATVLAVALAATALGSCTPDATPVVEPTTIPASTQPVDGRVVELTGGVRVIFEDELPSTATLTVATADAPPLPDGAVPLSNAIELILTGADLGSGATLEFPIPDGVNPGDGLTVSTFDDTTGEWVDVETQVDAEAGVVRAFTTHFSWWAPWTWDWAGIGAAVNQGVGQVVGKRASQASCTRGQPVPDWVRTVVGVSNEAAIAVRACTEGEGDVLAVELVNNRPYGQVVTYGSAVQWGWHETGSSAADEGRNQLVDALIGDNQLYIPPLGRASVGILQTAANSTTSFHIGVSGLTLVADVLSVTAGATMGTIGSQVAGAVSGQCGAWLWQLTPFSAVSSADEVATQVQNAASCLQAAFVQAVKDGTFRSATVAQLERTLEVFKTANRVGWLLTAYDVEWRLLELYVDTALVGAPAAGNGFTVYAAAGPTPPAETPVPAAPAPAAPQAPAPPAPPPPVTPPAATMGFTITDSFLNGTWARTDPDNGTWYSKGNKPANGAYWYPNGLGVAVDCARSAATYDVRWADGHTETWSWWLHVTDGKWIPAAVAIDVNANPGVANC